MPSVMSKPADKLAKNVAKINTRLMEENMTLKAQVEDQLRLIESMRARKSKAHRRLKALRELNKHVALLQAEVNGLIAQNENLRLRLITRPVQERSIFELVFGKRGF